MLFKFILLLGVIIAATIGKAADDGSLGTEIFFPFNKGLPSNCITFDPSSIILEVILAPSFDNKVYV